MAARIFQLLDKSFVDLDKLLKLLEDKFGADYQVEVSICASKALNGGITQAV